MPYSPNARPVGKLGRLPARWPVGLRPLSSYAPDGLPDAPDVFEGAQVAQWGMYGNDKVGDCTFAGFIHLIMAVAALCGEPEVWPSDGKVIQAYLAYTHGKDTGAVEADVLHTAQVAGILGHQIVGYAPVRADELEQVVSLFGAAYLGVALPAPAQQQFAAGEPWDLTGTMQDRQIVGGHCVVDVGYDRTAATHYVVTWGQRQPVTRRWLDTYCEERWAVLPEEVEHAGRLDGVAVAALQADLERISQDAA